MARNNAPTERVTSRTYKSGTLFHARHAFMPNKLGFCGPDDRGSILQHLVYSTIDEKLISILRNFEAAYPFLRLIAESTGRDPFDYKVAEAYWIGNNLLSQVSSDRFYKFALDRLKKKNHSEIKKLFLSVKREAMPHHTFYVLNTATSTFSDFHHTSAVGEEKIGELIDNCRISYGRVVDVRKDNLIVRYKPIVMKNSRIKYLPYTLKKVQYDPRLPPFDKISRGMVVNTHWNYACAILSRAQAKSIEACSERDVKVTNSFLEATRKE